MAGNWRQVAHFEEWLCALLAPRTPLLLLSGGGGEAEKALIISIDCASSRPRDTAASGQHRPRGCPPIILQTQPDSNKISPSTHLSLVDAEDWQQLCLFYQELLLMLHLVQLVAIKLEKLPPHLIEWDLRTTEVEQQAVPTTQPSS